MATADICHYSWSEWSSDFPLNLRTSKCATCDEVAGMFTRPPELGAQSPPRCHFSLAWTAIVALMFTSEASLTTKKMFAWPLFKSFLQSPVRCETNKYFISCLRSNTSFFSFSSASLYFIFHLMIFWWGCFSKYIQITSQSGLTYF